ncbi:hypothetical protein ES705_31489 [subsurface metagenome]
MPTHLNAKWEHRVHSDGSCYLYRWSWSIELQCWVEHPTACFDSLSESREHAANWLCRRGCSRLNALQIA